MTADTQRTGGSLSPGAQTAAWAAAVGVVAYLAALAAQLVEAGSWSPANDLPQGGPALAVLVVGLLAPLLETAVFFVVAWLLRLIPAKWSWAPAAPAYIVVMAGIGYLAHGGGVSGVGRAIGFALLAWLFWRTQARMGARAAFVTALAAHVIWNILAVATVYARG